MSKTDTYRDDGRHLRPEQHIDSSETSEPQTASASFCEAATDGTSLPVAETTTMTSPPSEPASETIEATSSATNSSPDGSSGEPIQEASPTVSGGEYKTVDGLAAADGVEPTSESDADGVPPKASSGAASADDAAASAGDAVEKTVQANASEEGAEKKKRKRRKRKKKKNEESLEQRANTLPFSSYFEGHSGARRSPFALGEAVAGVVKSTEGGTILLDLFGRAAAVVDVAEPREVPPLPDSSATESQVVESSADPGVLQVPRPEAEDASSEERPEVGVESSVVDSDEGESASPRAELSPDEHAAAAEPGAITELSQTGIHAEEEHSEAHSPAADSGVTQVETALLPEAAVDASDAVDAVEEELPPEEELQPLEPPLTGSVFRGRIGAIAESGDIILLNRTIDRGLAKKRLVAAREGRRRVRGIVYGFNRGGFDVLVSGIRTFCPASGMSLAPIEDPYAFVGKKLEFSVPQSRATGSGIIVSRRSILEREQRKHAREKMKLLKPGERLKGRVIEVREYGFIVDVGDKVEGLVHQSEVSWTRGVRPADVVKPGDDVEVLVLKVTPATRKDRFGRLSLSLRAALPDPWDEQEDLLKLNAHHTGKVVGTTEFGAFVELAPGIEGLLHISELGRDLKHANAAVSEGDEVHVIIDRVDRKQRRISLSKLSDAEVAALASGEVDLENRPKSLKPGAHVTVKIERVDHAGVSVQVQGVLGKRGRGFVANRELGAEQTGKKKLEAGQELTVKIIGTDRDGGLRCSIRARQQDEERKAVASYRRDAAKQGLGTFGDLLKAKLGRGS
ncbi:MAG: S1 RNA-binding domain-containing protein [Myxococcota bacterium]